ncbi:RNA ligase [Bacillus sp. M6-12]|uniref:RNA ligase n=1 Tax=Bacillus sp. M6-12 TaxID=2054166 RepID=UPI0015E07E1B|nr:RNA ligase [Bacillus sp. M6-12]
MMMNHWNVPVVVLSTVKQLVQPLFKNKNLTIVYDEWIELLSQSKIDDTTENRTLLESVMKRLEDKNADYHIMNLEGLISASAFEEESIPLREKMKKVYERGDFESYRSLYQEDINKMKLLFLEMTRHVSSMQVGELIVFKYGKEVSFYDLWNEFYMETRGVIVDLRRMELVASPYRKFFNFNEKPFTSVERITQLLKEAKEIVIKNKEDGSMVSVTKYNGQIIVATPGSMESSQAQWAKAFLSKHYQAFLDDMPSHITFIFEAIYPENRIVIDYQGEEKMVLTNMRSTLNGMYFEDTIVQFFGLMYKIPTPEVENKALSELIEEAQNKELHPADKKEGWVFTVKTLKEELMFKLKCEDYCEIHKVIGVANSPKVVFEQIVQDTFDDFIAKVPDVVKPLVYDIANVIWEYIQSLKKDVEHHLSLIPKEILFSKEEIENHMEFKQLVKEEIAPLIDDKLSKNKKTELEEALLSKAFGKEPFIDKYTEKEFQRLWSLIPSHLQNQKEFKKKEGRLLGFVHKQVPNAYKAIALEHARGFQVEILSLVDIKDIRFDFLKESKTEVIVEE